MPVLFHFIKPVPNWCECIEIYFVDADSRVMRHAVFDYESRLAQHAKMSAERRRAHVYPLRQLACPKRCAQQLANDGTPGRIGERGEGRIEIDARRGAHFPVGLRRRWLIHHT